ncbi:ABC transporter ATP-binding protein [Paenibacillus beijingensis]|uniref:ABC transporter ATP-binding protein n=1 Tax=Paenibacillus beijingensis TaxID=1126833 RepID=UPI000697E981|nr:ABC transporter ATP-binding protein [Paenibacillus beijingensis]
MNEVYGKTIIVIEHHTEFIADYCGTVALMDGGRLLWKRPTREALSDVEALTARGIFPPPVTQAAASLGITVGTEGLYPIRMEEAADAFGSAAIADKREPAPPSSLSSSSNDGFAKTTVEFRSVSHAFQTVNRKFKPVLQDITLSLQAGERIALVGNNGAGKSTLMKLMTGITRPKSGAVFVKGTDTRSVWPEKLSDTVSFIYQNPEAMFIDDTIRKDISYFLKARGVPDVEMRVDEVLERFELTHLQHRDGRLLSGGQQRKASLAIGAAMRPAVLLLDEPTSNLDMAARREVQRMLQWLDGYVETVVMASHDMQLVAEWADRIVVMHQGRIARDGDRDDVFLDMALMRRAGLVPPQMLELSHRLNLVPPAYTFAEFIQRHNYTLVPGEERTVGTGPKLSEQNIG